MVPVAEAVETAAFSDGLRHGHHRRRRCGAGTRDRRRDRAEGGTIAFAVTLTGSTSRTTTVDYATAEETAHEDADYEPVHGTLAFLPGESAKTVAVTLVDDDVHEDAETFTLNLSMAENAAVSAIDRLSVNVSASSWTSSSTRVTATVLADSPGRKARVP